MAINTILDKGLSGFIWPPSCYCDVLNNRACTMLPQRTQGHTCLGFFHFTAQPVGRVVRRDVCVSETSVAQRLTGSYVPDTSRYTARKLFQLDIEVLQVPIPGGIPPVPYFDIGWVWIELKKFNVKKEEILVLEKA